MAKCPTCCDKKYIGLKRHECLPGQLPNDRPCPDCAQQTTVGPSRGALTAVDVGTLRSAIDLRTAMNRAHCKMNNIAQNVLGCGSVVNISPVTRQIRLRYVPLMNLGLRIYSVTVEDVLSSGAIRGLNFLPAEVAPQFRLQQTKPIPWRWLIIGTPTFHYLSNQCAFIITNNMEGYSLRAVHADSLVMSQYPPNNHLPNEVMTVWQE